MRNQKEMIGWDASVAELIKLMSFERIKELAEEDKLPQAQTILGAAYWNGYGTRKNRKKALKWLRLAARNGMVEAQTFMFGYYFFKKKDNRIAKKWVERACAQEYPKALYYMGALLINGYIYKENYRGGLKYLKRSARYGYADAQIALGKVYYYGEVTRTNYKEARYWLRLGALAGDAECQLLLGVIYADGDGFKKRRKYKMAIKWWTLGAEQGDAHCQMFLSFLYKKGYGVEKDTAKSKQLEKLASREISNAKELVADFY